MRSNNVILLFGSPSLYFIFKAILDFKNLLNYGANYELHAFLYFMSFLVFPAFYLRLKNQKLGLFCSKKSFLAGLFAYIPFLPLFLFLFGPVLGATGKGIELLILLILMCLNVSAVDFYVWRVWQANFNKFVGFAVWLIVHIPESIFLAQYGIPKVLFFMIITGVVFSVVYDKTKCVGGLMAGHIAINVGMALIRGEWW
ncbi:MAG: hypothetical protein QFX36_08615 [Archaeoglobales archaeon]|nr:hypothetical protein [Archaeoglobales archaeon]